MKSLKFLGLLIVAALVGGGVSYLYNNHFGNYYCPLNNKSVL